MKAGKLLKGAAILMAGGAMVAWFVTQPHPLPASTMDGLTGDPEAGRLVFAAGGCTSCHTAEGSEETVLAGGKAFASAFGTFYAPNISSHAEAGIGAWTPLDLANAMLRGVSPKGAHYYPAFPYTSYKHVAPQDVADLHAYMMTLPASTDPSKPHDVGFPFNIRRSLGGWKLLFNGGDWVVDGDLTAEQERGRYLVEGLGHCAECHTPRNALGALDKGRWLGGAPNPSGSGNIPTLRPQP